MNGERILDISWGTILKLALATLLLYILYLIRDILIWFVFALIISILFNPVVDFLQKKKVPRFLGATFIYLVGFGCLGFLLYFSASIFISEFQEFSQFLPQYFEKASPLLKNLGLPVFKTGEEFLQIFGGSLERATKGIGTILYAIFGGALATVFTLALAFFLSLEKRPVERSLAFFFPKKYETYAQNLWKRSQKKVTGWFLGRVIACLFVGLLTFLALLLFKAKYPFSLGILAGLLNFVPIIGPVITGALIFLLIFFDNLWRAIFALAAFILIQQIENNILSPILAKKFIGLSPVLVLMALAIGGILWGFLGAILAVPLAGILFEFLTEFWEKRKEERTQIL